MVSGGSRRRVQDLQNDRRTYCERSKQRACWQGFFCIFKAQENWRFVLLLTFGATTVCFSVFDHGGTIHSEAFDISMEPKLFLHLILGLTFGSAAQISYDTSIRTSATRCTVIIDRIQYKLDDTTFWNFIIHGRATGCWIVSHGKTRYAIKQGWVEPDHTL